MATSSTIKLADVEAVRKEVEHYEEVRKEIKMASGDYIDMKLYEPGMHRLLDTYIEAEEYLRQVENLTLLIASTLNQVPIFLPINQ